MPDTRSASTRQALVDATMRVIRKQGAGAVSARTIAAAGDVNQALVFYHFGTVDALVAHACLVSTQERIDAVGAEFDAVQDFGGLVALAGRVHAQEQAAGNVTVLAQILAASHANPALAEAAGGALALWTDRVRDTLDRVMVGSPLTEVADSRALADLISALFVGLELMAPTRTGDAAVDAGLAGLGRLASTLDGLGPVSRRAVRAALRSS